MSCPCTDCAEIVAPVLPTLKLDPTTGDLTLLPNGSTVNLINTIHNFETITSFSNFRLVGNILEITYIPENGATEIKTVDLTDILGGGSSPSTIVVADSDSIDLNVSISNVLSGTVKIDPASTAPISASASGIRIDCCTQTMMSVVDTNTINLTASGTDNHTLTAQLNYANTNTVTLSEGGSGLIATVKLSSNPGNLITVDGANGLLATSLSETPIVLNDSNTINFTGSGSGNHTITADIIIDPASTAPHSVSSSGLLLNCCAQTPLSLLGGPSTPIALSFGGLNSHQIYAGFNFLDSNSIDFSLGAGPNFPFTGSVKYSTDANNQAHAGTDGAIFVGPATTVAPTVNAGPDQSITLPTSSVTLAGSGSTTVGTMSGYIWNKVSGPTAYNITDTSLLTSTITGLVSGIYKFRLLGINSVGLSAIDDMLINVSTSGDLIFYGVRSSISFPGSIEISSGSQTTQNGASDVNISWIPLTTDGPHYCWFAIPALGTLYDKNRYYMTPLNNGNIGGSGDLFGAKTTVLIGAQNYYVWITNYATQFVDVSVLQHV